MIPTIKAGVVGGEGYLAGELIRLLHYHEEVNLKFIHNDQYSGKRIAEVHREMEWDDDLIFSDIWDADVDIIFLCDVDQSRSFLLESIIPFGVKVVSLSTRSMGELDQAAIKSFAYGIPEINKDRIKNSDLIINPGCYETSVELALIPLVRDFMDDIHVYSLISATSVNQVTSPVSHFNWRSNNIAIDKFITEPSLTALKGAFAKSQPEFQNSVQQVLVLGNFTRGIFTTIYTRTELPEEELTEMYKAYYAEHPFIVITNEEVHLKQVVNTNNCFISVKKKGDFVFIVSILDNLMKGGAGQAIQNMNIMFALPETTGLRFKPAGF